MSQENIDPTMNKPLPESGAPFLYMQGDEPPGGGGGLRPTTTNTEEPDPTASTDEVNAYIDPNAPPVSDSSTDTKTDESLPAGTTSAIGDEPPGGGGGGSTS
ncbi:MAG TPA: hypothetical protein VE842_00315 [Pyrinomonadaceae bacterium]|jgi:hypothetical protein|nr:hypothetical protein [Pyrinomonadaceae bacterium]